MKYYLFRPNGIGCYESRSQAEEELQNILTYNRSKYSSASYTDEAYRIIESDYELDGSFTQWDKLEEHLKQINQL